MIIYAITACFMVLDFLSGLTAAFAKNEFTSTKMRTGIFHKVALLLCMILGYLVDFAQNYLDLGISVPVGTAICAYIVLMELFSIVENACKINPQLVPDKIFAIFGKNHIAEEIGKKEEGKK